VPKRTAVALCAGFCATRVAGLYLLKKARIPADGIRAKPTSWGYRTPKCLDLAFQLQRPGLKRFDWSDRS